MRQARRTASLLCGPIYGQLFFPGQKKTTGSSGKTDYSRRKFGYVKPPCCAALFLTLIYSLSGKINGYRHSNQAKIFAGKNE